VSAPDLLAAHDRDQRHQEIADAHHPALDGCAADVDACVAQQDHALTIWRAVIRVFADDRIDDHLIADQALLDDPRRQRCSHHAAFFAPLAGTLLAPGHLHEVRCRLHIQLFAYFVADDRRLPAAAAAYTLLGRAGNHALHARKIRRQRLTARMLALFLVWRCW